MNANIFYAWELGGNLGHVGQFVPLARRLKAAGGRIECALAFTGGVGRMLSPEGLSWVQAPVFRGPIPPGVGEQPVSYADILLMLGWADAGELTGLVGAWRRLMELSQASLVIADHSPTALLAARTLGLPAMLHGTGFYAPPDISPLPAMRPWVGETEERLRASEDRAIETANLVVQEYGGPPLARLGQLFDVAEPGLGTLPELDPYPQRPGGRYWGLTPSFAAAPIEWPAGAGPRIFGYLRAAFRGTEEALAALATTRCRAYIICPDAPEAWRERFAGSHVTLARGAVDLDQAGREADAAILYAPHSTTAALLRHGLPMVLIPENLEQGLVAQRVEAMGAGFWVGRQGRFQAPAAALAALLSSGAVKAAAMAFARRYREMDSQAVLEAMTERALGLAAGAPQDSASRYFARGPFGS
jgi:hypothetical protein